MANEILKKHLLFAGILMNFILLSTCKNDFLNSQFLRNLQYAEFSSNGVYYLIDNPKNSITGTGDRLKDTPYKALCVIKDCPSGCCIGEINNLECGLPEDCKMYFGLIRRGHVSAAVLIPIAVTAAFFVGLFVMRIVFKATWTISLLTAFTCIFIITIPFVICYFYKNKKLINCEKSPKSKKEEDKFIKGSNDIELLKSGEGDKIILCDNKRQTGDLSKKDYNKLSMEEKEESNRNINIVSVSSKHENGQKRTNMPDIIFDDNVRDEKLNQSGSNKDNSYNQKSINLNDGLGNTNNQYNNSIPNMDDDDNDLLDKSKSIKSQSKKSDNGYNRQDSNANRSIKSSNQANGETPKQDESLVNNGYNNDQSNGDNMGNNNNEDNNENNNIEDNNNEDNNNEHNNADNIENNNNEDNKVENIENYDNEDNKGENMENDNNENNKSEDKNGENTENNNEINNINNNENIGEVKDEENIENVVPEINQNNEEPVEE